MNHPGADETFTDARRRWPGVPELMPDRRLSDDAISHSRNRLSPDAYVEVEGLVARYGQRRARGSDRKRSVLEDVSFEVKKGTVFVLLGQSGCGKSTTLRCVAGLHEPEKGLIALNGRTVFSAERGINMPPEKRSLGMVFQSYALWPHMTVLQNVQFALSGLRRSRLRKAGVASAAAVEALRNVGLHEFANVYPGMLSGGQQQRVALARALVGRPDLLLLDEPLSNLDASIRLELRRSLRETLVEQAMTAIYVTHDYEEALSVGDDIAVMSEGKIVERGAPLELFRRPMTTTGALAVGRGNVIVGDCTGVTDGAATVETRWGTLRCGCALQLTSGLVGKPVNVLIRPSDLEILPDRIPMHSDEDLGSLEGVCSSKSFLGEVAEYEVANGTEQLVVRQMPGDVGLARMSVGEPVNVRLNRLGWIVDAMSSLGSMPVVNRSVEEPLNGRTP